MSTVIDTRQLKRASKLVKGTVTALEKAEYRTVNRVASKTRTAGSKEIRSRVNLKAAYVNQHLRLFKKATPGNPRAVITARKRPTRLARYGAKQITRAAKGAAGDSSRAIPAGKKQGGVSVQVSKGSGRRRMPKAFLVPLKTNGLTGVFIRTGTNRGDIKHLYGPSVDQVFRSVRDDLKPTIRKEIVKEFKAQMNYARQGG